ncbi:MAG TPA: sulfurtransferase [Saprospiraceae bacterium]|nr:sulfurtransferase [Saprospiraceae bacterium]
MQAIVSTDWLQEQLDDPQIILLFVMGLKKSQSALAEANVQIPGSRWFDLNTTFKDPASSLPNTLPNPADFQKNCQELGINQDSTIVLYDASGIYASPRAWWLFRVMGHKKVVVLNGGLPAWLDAGGVTEAFQKNAAEKGNFITELQIDQVQYTDAMLENTKQQQAQVLDARSAGRFAGTEPEPRAGLSSGHIPGSKSLPFTKVLKDGKFKSTEELKKVFKDLQLDERPLVFSCGSGITACISLLAAEQVLENPTSVYDGSWTEWATTEGLPVAKAE